MNLRLLATFAPLAVIFAGGGLVARAVAGAAPHANAIAWGFTQPLVVVTGWGAYGTTCALVLVATVVAAALALALAIALRTTRATAGTGDLAAIVVATGAALVAALAAWPFVFSSDVYAYAAYGASALAGRDPYAPLGAGVHDAIVDAARAQWGGDYPVCAYGPAFVALSRAIVAGARGDLSRALLDFRALAALALVGGACALWLAFDPADVARRRLAVAAYALNPVVVWSAVEGHNDTLVAFVTFCGLALARRGGAFAGGALLTGAAMLKATALPFAALVACATVVTRRPPARARTLAGLAFGLALAAVVAIPPATRALAVTRSVGHFAPVGSLGALAGPAFALAVALALGSVGVVRVARSRADGFAACGLAVWLALPNPYPWYAAWLVPFAVFGRGTMARALWAVTISSVVRYLPDANGDTDAVGRAVTALLVLSPLVVIAPAALARAVKLQKATP